MPTNLRSYGTLMPRLTSRVIRGSARYKGKDTMQSMENFIASTYGTTTNYKTLEGARKGYKRNKPTKKQKEFSGSKYPRSFSMLTPDMRKHGKKPDLSNIPYAAPSDPFNEGLSDSERALQNDLIKKKKDRFRRTKEPRSGRLRLLMRNLFEEK